MSLAAYSSLWLENLSERLPPVVGRDHAVFLWLLTRVLRDRLDSNRFVPWQSVSLAEREELLSTPEAPACVTVRTESADCQWCEGNQCRLALQSCSSVWCHFLEGEKIWLYNMATSRARWHNPRFSRASVHGYFILFSVCCKIYMNQMLQQDKTNFCHLWSKCKSVNHWCAKNKWNWLKWSRFAFLKDKNEE